MKTLYVDIDSCIWPAEDAYGKAYFETYGEYFDFSNLYQALPTDDHVKVFINALTAEPVEQRPLYAGVEDALLDLYNIGYNIFFLSHNPKPKLMHDLVDEWLTAKLGFPYRLKIFGARNCKIQYMQGDETTWGIIEDKPSTLVKAKRSGIRTIAKLQPWNLDVVEEYDIMSFSKWSEVPQLVHDMEGIA